MSAFEELSDAEQNARGGATGKYANKLNGGGRRGLVGGEKPEIKTDQRQRTRTRR